MVIEKLSIIQLSSNLKRKSIFLTNDVRFHVKILRNLETTGKDLSSFPIFKLRDVEDHQERVVN